MLFGLNETFNEFNVDMVGGKESKVLRKKVDELLQKVQEQEVEVQRLSGQVEKQKRPLQSQGAWCQHR